MEPFGQEIRWLSSCAISFGHLFYDCFRYGRLDVDPARTKGLGQA